MHRYVPNLVVVSLFALLTACASTGQSEDTSPVEKPAQQQGETESSKTSDTNSDTASDAGAEAQDGEGPDPSDISDALDERDQGEPMRNMFGEEDPTSPPPPGDATSSPDGDPGTELDLGSYCDEPDVRDTLEARQEAIHHCYERQLQSTPDLEGVVELSWQIHLDGSARSVIVVASTIDDESVESCLTRVIASTEFTEPDGGMCAVSYPVNFKTN